MPSHTEPSPQLAFLCPCRCLHDHAQAWPACAAARLPVWHSPRACCSVWHGPQQRQKNDWVTNMRPGQAARARTSPGLLWLCVQAEAGEQRQELEADILQLRTQLQERQQAPDSTVRAGGGHQLDALSVKVGWLGRLGGEACWLEKRLAAVSSTDQRCSDWAEACRWRNNTILQRC